MSFDPECASLPGAKIKVVGIGGGGGNAVNTMIRADIQCVEFITANTDIQSLKASLAPTKVQIGRDLTRGLGAGADPDVGREAALENRQELQQALAGADMVFITAGMGGGTGTGGASVVAQIARELGALTVAVVTKPFHFEGKRRRKHSEIGIARLRESVDTLITIPNQRLLQVAPPDMAMVDAFKMADDVLVNAVRGINDIINVPGVVNVDFADVKTVMSCMGQALMGIGMARGENRAAEAARQAVNSPLLEDVDIEGATGILINIAAGSNVTLREINDACSLVYESAHEDANIIFGAVIDEVLGDYIRVSVIATGFPVEPLDEEAIISSMRPKSPLRSPARPSLPQSPSATPITPEAPMAAQPAPAASIQAPAEPPRAAAAAVQPEAVFSPAKAEVFSAPTPEPVPAKVATPAEAPSEMAFAAHAIDESQELARMTFGDDAFDDSLMSELETKSDDDLQRLDGARLISDPSDDFAAAAALFASESQEDIESHDDVAAASAKDLELAPQEKTLESHEEVVDNTTPLDSFFAQENDAMVHDIDRKIDEALDLAERLRGPMVERNEEDELDVPAFLRSGAKDLSLS